MDNMINLNKIDLLAFWKTHYGELIPLKLQPGCAAHLKILFRHRSFGDSNQKYLFTYEQIVILSDIRI